MGPFRTRYAPDVHLYAAFLGGDLGPGRMGEDHEVVFVVADDMPAARRAAKAKWRGDGKAHVDALTRLDMIDGYAVGLQPGGSGDDIQTEGYDDSRSHDRRQAPVEVDGGARQVGGPRRK